MMFDPYPAGLPIGPGWLSTPDTQEITFPYDGSIVAEAPVGTPELARIALNEAVAVKRAVAALPSWARRDVLLSVHRALSEWRDEFEGLLVAETGKPLVDCRVEVARALVTWQAAAEEAGRIHGETVPLDLAPSGDGLTGFWQRKPIGVVVGIAGFNYPLLLASHKIAPAIAAGCPIVVKPAPQTPLATLWLVHLVREAAAIPAMVQLVTGDAEVGSTLVADWRVGAVSFTGSAAVGHRIAKAAAPTKTLLELGSNAALVVAEDADLEAAADAVLTNVPDGVSCWDEEIFGPVVSVRRASTVDEAFEQVNASRYGHASVFTRSLATAFRAIDQLDVGGVVVNEVPGFRSDTMPYGGVKDSGIGREGPRFAIDELTVTRMAVLRP
jgi:acyl-CoA reductase-like NAD-dependent aldehyde dehydrogenase